MRLLRFLSLASILLFSSSALAQRWAPFTDEDGKFQIMSPGGTFDIETVDFETEYGIVVPAKVHKAVTDQGTFTLTVVDYTDSMELHMKRLEELDGIYLPVYGEVDVRGSIAFAARGIRERAESVDTITTITSAASMGISCTRPIPTGRARSRASTCSRASCTSSTRGSIPAHLRAVCSSRSFQFIDEDGNGIFFDSFRQPRKVRVGGEWIRPSSTAQ